MGISPLIILFIKGVLIGFAIAAPVGPIGIMCIRRSLAGYYGISLVIGLGAGLADTVYGAIAGFSLASIADILHHYNFYLRLFGGLLVGWIGIYKF
jgi:threonine/homoserine/homoserine lactone efflux protein